MPVACGDASGPAAAHAHVVDSGEAPGPRAEGCVLFAGWHTTARVPPSSVPTTVGTWPAPLRASVLIDRSHSGRLPRASFKGHSGALMTHTVRAEGATPDWRSPPYVGSGPFAIAGPCARVPGRYAEPRKVKKQVGDRPRPHAFTGIGGHPHNRAGRPHSAGGMGPSSTPGDPRRWLMSRGDAVVAPPRARRPFGHRRSTNSGIG